MPSKHSHSRRKSRSGSNDYRRRDKERKPRSRSNENHNSRINLKPKKKRFFKSPSKSKSKNSEGGFRFDSPPREHTNPNIPQPIPFNVSNIRALSSVFPDLTPSEIMTKLQTLAALQTIQSSKSDKKLYVGNLPPGITNEVPGNSIISSWISPEDNYAFVEFRTKEEAEKAIALNQVAVKGHTLKVGKPKSFTSLQNLPNVQNLLSFKFLNIVQLTNPLISSLAPMQGISAKQDNDQEYDDENSNAKKAATSNFFRIYLPSRVLVLKYIIEEHELEIEEEYNEIFEDIKEECSRYGKVVSVKIPRPNTEIQTPQYLNGVGKAYVEFKSENESREARKALNGRLFSNKILQCSYHDDRKYQDNDFSDSQV